MSESKFYLGDGAYVDWDGYAVILTTENGLATKNTIVLEPDVFAALMEWASRRTKAALTRGT